MNNKNGVIVIWWIILMIALLIAFGFWLGEKADAKLSDDTLEIIEDLRIKHYGYSGYLSLMDSDISIEWASYYSWTMYFEDGKLFVETQDSKWFIEMEKIEEKD